MPGSIADRIFHFLFFFTQRRLKYSFTQENADIGVSISLSEAIAIK
jgi:hypothetical protein